MSQNAHILAIAPYPGLKNSLLEAAKALLLTYLRSSL